MCFVCFFFFYPLTLETSRPQCVFMFAPVGAGVAGHVCLKAGGAASFIRGPRCALSHTT